MIHTRTIQEAAAFFRENDPGTSLTQTAIRRLIRTGQVPSVRVGKKYLVSLESLERFLENGNGPFVQMMPSQNHSCNRAWRIE